VTENSRRPQKGFSQETDDAIVGSARGARALLVVMKLSSGTPEASARGKGISKGKTSRTAEGGGFSRFIKQEKAGKKAKPEGRARPGRQAKRNGPSDGNRRSKAEGGLRSEGKRAAEKRGAEKRGRSTRNAGGWKSKRGTSASNRAKNTAKTPDIASQTDQREDLMRINKFIAHAGYCSRREADLLIEQGKVTVNGEVVMELGAKVKRQDVIVVDGQRLSLEPFIYIC
jgi:16S rRNA uridine-516 pseudouridylate synthase and related pseudouridylate synthases